MWHVLATNSDNKIKEARDLETRLKTDHARTISEIESAISAAKAAD